MASQIEHGTVRILDASSLINLLALEPEQMDRVLSVHRTRFVVPHPVVQEAVRDPRERTRAPILPKSLETIPVPTTHTDTFLRLCCELGDGEAATLTIASALRAVAVLDDQQARRLGSSLNVRMEWTVQLLLGPSVAAALGIEAQADAVYRALQLSRMRVPAEHMNSVVDLIGRDRAMRCSSLRLGKRKAP